MVLWDRDRLGLSVNSRARAEHKSRHTVGHHSVQKANRPADVIREVAPRLAHGLRRDDVTAVVDDGVEVVRGEEPVQLDRKSTRLNSSHVAISYAVFCLKK